MLLIITPAIGWSWPALAPVVAAVAGYFGFSKLTERGEKGWLQGEITEQLRNKRIVEIPLQTEALEPVAEELGHDEVLAFQKDDITLMFIKDARGKISLKVLGDHTRTKQELHNLAQELAISIIQQFAHARVVRELDRKGITVVAEERNAEGDLVLRTRKWG